MSTHAHTNRLARETSPYLLQHAHNPVDWYPWGEEALARAREEGKPILLSVGYSSCHWCHVMAHESFENEEIARQMNEDFVCIKVDREERPDIDHLYMNAVQMLTGQGGWPMTVFLTPDGKPFYGGTYFPPEDRYGRPGFPRVLQAIAEAWKQNREQIEQQGAILAEHIRAMSELQASPAPVTLDTLERAFAQLHAAFDENLGGFGEAPKFPQPMVLDFLLRFSRRAPDSGALGMVNLTFERMAEGGIYDQLGGGFHRYSTDPYWLVPHFEKMLYDNAQLARTYLHAWQATGDAYFRRITEETLDYVRREMTAPGGGFYSAQDADTEGEEGRFYVWTLAEVEEVLGKDDALLFARCYDVTPRGNWERRNILNLSGRTEALARAIGVSPEALQERLDGMRRKLFERRETRVKPGRDEKVLVAWNGLMLAAFADAAAALGRADYRETAERNADFVLRELMQDGRLMRTGREEADGSFRVAPIAGFLDDYACYADGLLRLYEATGEWRWFEAARQLADTMRELFADPNGGFFNTASDAGELIGRPKEITDSAVPSGNSVASGVLLRLAELTGEEAYRREGAALPGRLAEGMAEQPQAFGRMLCVADFLVGPVRELAVVGAPDDPGTCALLDAARAGYYPNLLLAQSAPGGDGVNRLPLFADRPQIDGRPTAYLCENNACKLPVTTPEELKIQLG